MGLLNSKKPDRVIRCDACLWREHLNPRKAGKVLVVVGVDAGDPVGHHRGHQEEVKELLAGYLDLHRVKRGHDSKHSLRAPQLRLLRELPRTYPDSPYVFVSERKTPLSPRSIREIVARADKLAGLPCVPHPHQLWHACGYYLASHRHETRAIQDYLGHNIQHTVRYTEMAPQRFANFWND